MEWLDERSSPILRFDHATIELSYQPVELEGGQSREMVRFKVECVIPHSAGRIIYEADDLFFFPGTFVEFADELKDVLDDRAKDAVLSPPGGELILTIDRVEKEIRLQIAASEFNAGRPPTTISATGSVAMDVAYRWARELKEEYAQRLNEWILQKSADQGTS